MEVVKVLFLTMVVALSADGVFSCMCMTEHPQTDFCNSDYVFRGKIISRTPIYEGMAPNVPTTIRYEVMPTNIYRRTGDSVQERTTVTLTTAGFESTCGVTNMVVDEAYLINAKEISGQLITTLCAWNSRFSALTSSQKKMLRFNYENECTRTPQCEVRMFCGPEHPIICPPFNGCTFRNNDCTLGHSFCTGEGGQCRWRNYNKGYDQCISSQGKR